MALTPEYSLGSNGLVERMGKLWQRWVILACCCLGLFACQAAKPPLEFAPDGAIVQQAIAFQLERTQAELSRQLDAPPPRFTVSQITVNTIEAIVVNSLPAYHLRGVYNLKLFLPRQTVTQKKNPFELYLQRQQEGKSWRLLQRDIDPRTEAVRWSSYLVDLVPPPDAAP
jgi:hypothetical protein